MKKATISDNVNRTVIIIMVWIVSLVILSVYSYVNVSRQIESNLGNKAMFAARSISNGLSLSDEEYETLADMEFKEVLNTEKNLEFEIRARKYMESTDIKYIYLESIIPESEARYSVEIGEEALFGVEAGTELTSMYLLDATKNEQIRVEDTNGLGYKDKYRYDLADEKFKNIYANGKATYRVSGGRWGEYITGYAPMYTESGKYVGMVGADIYKEKYLKELGVFVKILSGFVCINIVAGIIIVRSAFKLKSTERSVERIKDHYALDYLTSVLNREKFLEKLSITLKDIVKHQNGVGLFMMDIDNFKNYNDNYGHIYGDTAIKVVCKEVRQEVEKYGGFIGRFGGDEFLIAFENTSHRQVSEIADEIVKKVECLGYKHEYSSISDVITVSLGGVSISATNDISMELAMERADIALYRAKKQGRNRALVLKMD